MFYCDPCAEIVGWPKSLSRSKGRCEMCGEAPVECSDRPSRHLDIPAPEDLLQIQIRESIVKMNQMGRL
jgi:hypothetical protein